MADLPRTLRKWHLSAAPPRTTTVESLLAAKSLSYMATDYFSPGLGAMAWACYQRTRHSLDLVVAMAVWRHKLSSACISLDDLASKGPPPFDASLAATYSYHYSVTIAELRRFHGDWIEYAHGGEMPAPLLLDAKEGAVDLLEY